MFDREELKDMREALAFAGGKSRRQARDANNSTKTEELTRLADRRFQLSRKCTDLIDGLPFIEFDKITPEFLTALLEYIKEMEEGIESYRGDSRSLAELVKDGDAPEVYNTLLEIIPKQRKRF